MKKYCPHCHSQVFLSREGTGYCDYCFQPLVDGETLDEHQLRNVKVTTPRFYAGAVLASGLVTGGFTTWILSSIPAIAGLGWVGFGLAVGLGALAGACAAGSQISKIANRIGLVGSHPSVTVRDAFGVAAILACGWPVVALFAAAI